MPRIKKKKKGRADRHFRCEVAGIEARPRLVLYVSSLFIILKQQQKKGVDAQKLPKCTANISTDLVFNGL